MATTVYERENCDGVSRVLAHHGGRAKTERRCDVEIQRVVMAETKKMMVSWVDT